MLPVLWRTKKSCHPTAGDVLYVKSKGRRTDTDNRPTIFHWEQRTPDGFNPEGRWLISLESIPVFWASEEASLLKGLGGCEGIQLLSSCSSTPERGVRRLNCESLVTVNPEILPDFPICSFRFECWRGTGKVEFRCSVKSLQSNKLHRGHGKCSCESSKPKADPWWIETIKSRVERSCVQPWTLLWSQHYLPCQYCSHTWMLSHTEAETFAALCLYLISTPELCIRHISVWREIVKGD